ncbi:hypothetical protein AOL_s00097g260 [Orbilia oligospora ATCC 24927]|uniref:Rhodopsin domain-containing protein n=1 Tax=Arthrobotrys oligospora (strain ATCC 24927 / CBS 115.81 / DSM 1491) TaxID=756982 RepID=G1XIT3_ARTOA|nr:hypothetical protein AOL_s00097g260 [Orbilia oligospora ATCC 24927]EGX46834.1 hypothetical protein AOL_s00097g260 [Orbilia oligospora ATCC 24927]
MKRIISPSEWMYTQNLCRIITWLTSEGQKSNIVASELVSSTNDWLQGVQNANTSAAEYAEFLDTSEEWVEVVWANFFGSGESYREFIALVNGVIPALGHPTQSAHFLPLFASLTIITTIVFALRIYSRLKVGGYIRAYDWIILAGFIITLATGIMRAYILTGPVHYRGVWDQSWDDYNALESSSLANNICYPIVVFLVKTSLLLFYYQLTAWKPLRWATIITFAVVTCNSLALLFGYTFRCIPVLGWRGLNFLNAYCPVKVWKLELGTSIVNIVTDVVIWLIPLPMIFKIIHTPTERFLAVLTFGIGALACICCGMRLSVMHNAWFSKEIGKPMDSSIVATWTQTELYMAIICSSVPAIRALIIKKAPRILGFTEGNVDSMEKSQEGRTAGKDGEASVDVRSVEPVSPV